MADRTFAPFPVLSTARLKLRQPVPADAPEIFVLRSDTEVNRYLGRQPCQSIDEALHFIDSVNENVRRNIALYWAIALKDTDRLVGTICLYNFSDKGHCEIGYELQTDFQRQGIMQEAVVRVIDYAFGTLQVQGIRAILEKGNKQSIRLLEKLSFIRSDETIENEPDLIGYNLINLKEN